MAAPWLNPGPPRGRVARPFHLDYLGFEVLWEHRFEPALPLYLRIARGDTVLDLSEHHGDGPPFSVTDPFGNVLRFCQPRR